MREPTGMIDLYRTGGRSIGVDACVPLAVAADMLAAAATAPRGVSIEMLQVEEGGPTSVLIEVPADAVETVLTPAVAAGVTIICG
jgi:hypothetical protein